MSNNWGFVAHLDSLVLMKRNNLFTLERFINTIRSFPVIHDYHLLKHQYTVMVKDVLEIDFTVKEMKIALDPLNNFSLLKTVGEEIVKWVDIYYQPYVAALFDMNVGSNPDAESRYFLTYGWVFLSSYMSISCLADNMRWDCGSSGCTTSLLVGYYAENYIASADRQCTKDNSNTVADDDKKCKYNQDLLINLKMAHNHFLPVMLLLFSL